MSITRTTYSEQIVDLAEEGRFGVVGVTPAFFADFINAGSAIEPPGPGRPPTLLYARDSALDGTSRVFGTWGQNELSWPVTSGDLLSIVTVKGRWITPSGVKPTVIHGLYTFTSNNPLQLWAMCVSPDFPSIPPRTEAPIRGMAA